jgi:hypothetical protein
MKATGPDQSAQLLLDITDFLRRVGVLYAIVGAFAVSFYGIPRSTADGVATIWLSGTGKSAKDVCDELVKTGYQAMLNRGDLEDPIQGVIVIEDDYENKADLLIGVRGMAPQVGARCISTTLLDSQVTIIGADDLVGMKVFAGGPQDLEDVRGILQVSGSVLNVELLRGLAARYGTEATAALDKLLAGTNLL